MDRLGRSQPTDTASAALISAVLVATLMSALLTVSHIVWGNWPTWGVFANLCCYDNVLPRQRLDGLAQQLQGNQHLAAGCRQVLVRCVYCTCTALECIQQAWRPG